MNFLKKLSFVIVASCALSQGVNASGWAHGEYNDREEQRIDALSKKLDQRETAKNQMQEVKVVCRLACAQARFEAREREAFCTRVVAVFVGICVCVCCHLDQRPIFPGLKTVQVQNNG